MSPLVERWLLPAFLLACLLVGGSTQNPWAVAVLLWAALAMLAWSFSTPRRAPSRKGRELLLFLAAAASLACLQLVPLPPGLWSALPGREFQLEGLRLLGERLPWSPLSLAPYDTLYGVLMLLVPAAVVVAMLRAGASPSRLVAALLIGAVAGALLGLFQVADGGRRFYPYRFSDWGTASGFFANTNHMATLLLVCLPYLAALSWGIWQRRRDAAARAIVSGGTALAGLLLAAAVFYNGSLAILALLIPVALASAAIPLWERLPGIRRWIAPSLIALSVAVAGASILWPNGADKKDVTSIDSRQQIWATTTAAIRDTGLIGTGGGSFAGVYRQHENPDQVDRFFVNHAHNDYLEIALEFGVPGLMLMAAFLLWWGRRVRAAWRRDAVSGYTRAASIASAAILTHSLVDFPLRTAALSAVFAMSIGFLVLKPSQKPVVRRDDLWPTRHLTAGQ